MGRRPGSKNKTKDESVNEVTVIPSHEKLMLLDYMADKYSLNAEEFSRTVKAICGLSTGTPEQFAAFLIVAKTYDLNPLIKEIYAFPGKGGGIVPIVSIDGWVNLVNSHPLCNGFQFEKELDAKGGLIAYTCNMHRKDREYSVNVTEYLTECKRATEPWKMEHRMLRHKAFIQAARLAFGFAGIYDHDEGERIASIDPTKDAGPPRNVTVIEHQAEEEMAEPEQARDGTPPRRQDPIISGPQAVIKDNGPSDGGIKPHKLPGAGETYETWSEKYSDFIKTSPDITTLYQWIDANNEPLGRLSKGKPSIAAAVKKVTENVLQALKDAKEKADAKAAKKVKPAEMEEAPLDPESILAAIDAELGAVEDADLLQQIWDKCCEELASKLEFPPDQDAAQGLLHKHEKRLGGD